MRSKKALMNTVVMGIYEIIALICGMIVPRLILGEFGSDYNGITNSITQFLSFISVIQAGTGGATRVALYKALADKDINSVSRILKANEIFMRRIAYIFAGYVLVVAVLYPFIANTEVSWYDCFLLIVITGIHTFGRYYFGITYQTLFKADQRNYVYYGMQIGTVILNTITAAVLVRLHFSIHIVKLCSTLVYLMIPIGLNLYAKKYYRLNMKCTPDNHALKQKWNVMAHTVANLINEQTDIIILTIFTTTKMVSVYSVYYLVLNGLRKVMMVFTGSMEAAFGNIWAKKEKELFNVSFQIFEYFVFCFVSVVFSSAVLLIVPFVKIYTAGITDVSYDVPLFAYLATSGAAAYCIRTPYVTIVQAAGKYKETRNGAVMEAVINIVLSITFVFFFGIVGVTVGTLTAHLFRTIQYARFSYKNLLDASVTRYIQRVLWLFLNVTVITGIVFFLKITTHIDSWHTFVIYATVVFLISCSVTLITSLLFCREEVKKAKRHIRKLTAKKKN